jgi:RNA ligase
MTTLDELFGPGALQAEIDAGHIRVGRSGDGLSIYNYTEAVQYGHHWNNVTTRCRGLIAEDETGRIVAWPFPKFFNYSEHGHGNPWAPDLPQDAEFTIYDKVDGSLGIVFWDRRQLRWRAASRGSFISEQAQWAQRWIDRHDQFDRPVTDPLDPANTYLAEIVYPTNRIVVNHGGRQDLVLLGVYNAYGGELAVDYHAPTWMRIGSVVRSWPQMPLDVLVEFAGRSADVNGAVRSGSDLEGYVLHYPDHGLRVKIKLADYVRLHAVLTGMNEKTVWEVLAHGSSFDDLLQDVPDEFMRWVQDVSDRLQQQHDAWLVAALMAYSAVLDKAVNGRREFAAEAVPSGYSSALFRLYDNKSINELAWKACKPSGLRAFATDEEG